MDRHGPQVWQLRHEYETCPYFTMRAIDLLEQLGQHFVARKSRATRWPSGVGEVTLVWLMVHHDFVAIDWVDIRDGRAAPTVLGQDVLSPRCSEHRPAYAAA